MARAGSIEYRKYITQKKKNDVKCNARVTISLKTDINKINITKMLINNKIDNISNINSFNTDQCVRMCIIF